MVKTMVSGGGRVTVSVRVRPGAEKETCTNLVANSLERRVEFRQDPNKRGTFVFDSVLGPGASQAVTYRAIAAPLVEHVLNGVSGCLIAYGQTGAGKTFSLMELTAGRQVCGLREHLTEWIVAESVRVVKHLWGQAWRDSSGTA